MLVAAATQRVVVLMPPEDKAWLEEKARRAGTSIGELVRRSVEAYDPELEGAELEALVRLLEEGQARAMRSLDEAEKGSRPRGLISMANAGTRPMGIADRIFDGLRTTIQLNERVSVLGQELKALSVDVRDLDRRLIRVETALELANSRQFAALPPGEDEPPRNT